MQLWRETSLLLLSNFRHKQYWRFLSPNTRGSSFDCLGPSGRQMACLHVEQLAKVLLKRRLDLVCGAGKLVGKHWQQLVELYRLGLYASAAHGNHSE